TCPPPSPSSPPAPAASHSARSAARYGLSYTSPPAESGSDWQAAEDTPLPSVHVAKRADASTKYSVPRSTKASPPQSPKTLKSSQSGGDRHAPSQYGSYSAESPSSRSASHAPR